MARQAALMLTGLVVMGLPYSVSESFANRRASRASGVRVSAACGICSDRDAALSGLGSGPGLRWLSERADSSCSALSTRAVVCAGEFATTRTVPLVGTSEECTFVKLSHRPGTGTNHLSVRDP